MISSMAMRKLGNLIIAIIGCFLLSGSVFGQEVGILSDSALKIFSVEELVKIRKMLAKEKDRLLKEQEKSREAGVELSREFLGKTKEENANQDKILIRVAEYYIEEERLDFVRRYEEYEREYDEFLKQEEAYREGKLKTPPVEPPKPHYNFEKAIAIYDLIIRNFPESDLVDDAYYNKAYLLDEMEEFEAARQTFQTLIDQYPESRYAPEAYMKLAESYFQPRQGDTKEETIAKLNKAIQLYKNVLQYKDSPRYDEALYKLGWSYYRLAGENPDYYTDAIVYFMAVVQDIERLKELDPTGEIVRTNVEPEALEFIAASFIDPSYSKSGVANARAFIEKLGKPAFGVTIMEKMGDRYAKITDWDNAILAYRELLDLYPDYTYAPKIQYNIAAAYLASGDFERAYEERQKLFEKYNPKSEWYANIERKDFPDRFTVLDEAYRLSEEALRANLFYTLNQAQQAKETEADSIALYEKFTALSRLYLETFPTDENAYEINWALAYVLDAKLHKYVEAFEEYLRVSNDYLEDSRRLDAANNAILVARTLVEQKRSEMDTTAVEGVEFAKLPPQELTPEEKMLAEAYDNFIKLFPESPDTPAILASAGQLYYTHRQFGLAKKYYKTMVSRFPEAQQKNIGLISLMNSYFFLGQYRDAEIVARNILASENIPEDQQEIARKRLGQSIYKNAEKLEQEGKYLEAAQEFYRVYTDARDYVDFADNALFRSASNYEKAGEWIKAIQMYDVCITEFPQSKLVLPALNNIALDYKEMEDYAKVASTYERIFDLFPNTPEAEAALYNASYFYERAEAWADAIRVNNRYIQAYPSNPESKNLLFDNARYYLKMDDIRSANRIYAQFSQTYPDDPRVVEAFYHRGNYYFEHGKFDSAKVEFNRAIQKSNEFARVGKDPNLYYAAESYFKLGEILYNEYKAIRLSYPVSTLRAQLNLKTQKLEEVRAAYTRVIELGSMRSFEALYKIAEAVEELANAIANQTLPPNLTREQRLVERNRVFQASVPAYDQAVEEYKNVVKNIPILAEKLGVSLEDTSGAGQAEVERDTTGEGLQKATRVDSTREVALKWYHRAQEKISQVLYTVAEQSAEFVNEYLRTPNPKTGVLALAYWDILIKQAVTPAVQTTMNAHLKNIVVSQELGLENKYVEESRRKILLTSNVLAEEYAKLFTQAGDVYQSSIPVLQDLIEKGEGATTPDGMDFYDFQDNVVMQTIYFMDQFSKTAINQYYNTLKFAIDHQIENDAKLTTEEKLFNFSYEAGTKMDDFAKMASTISEQFLDKFDSTSLPIYQLGSAFFDDQRAELETYSKDVLAFAFDVKKELQVENIWTRLILAKLVELDPATYLEDLPKEQIFVQSDSTWVATTRYELGWNLSDFDDSAWEFARVVNVPFELSFPKFDSLGISPPAIWVSRYVPTEGSQPSAQPSLELRDIENFERPDTATSVANPAQDTVQIVSEPDSVTAYFRKKFSLSAQPVGGWLAITADNTYRVFINDNYVIGRDTTDFQNVVLVPFEAIEPIIHEGENVLAISVTDDAFPRYGLRCYLNFSLLPVEITQAVEKIRQVEQQVVDPGIFKRVVTLNKNRVIVQ